MVRNKKTDNNVDLACPHTIKKFELIEAYVRDWAHKLLNYENCNEIVFIDCMCNSGHYKDSDDQDVFGTPIRVAKLIEGLMTKYTNKKATLYFNDLSQSKIDILSSYLPSSTGNFHITTRVGDGNELLKEISKRFQQSDQINYLVVYDPYTASVDWGALLPFFRSWGEVIINHMVSDPIRGLSQAKSDAVVEKYEKTYLASIKDLMPFGNDRNAYENRIQEIIVALRRGLGNKKCYIASFPFFNTRNVVVYNLLHCSGNIEGFKLFKRVTWKVFDGKSSSKDTHGKQNQLAFDLDDLGGIKTNSDENCYYIKDIADYIYNKYHSKGSISLDEVWTDLDIHPVFPSEGFRNEIKRNLKDFYKCKVTRKEIFF